MNASALELCCPLQPPPPGECSPGGRSPGTGLWLLSWSCLQGQKHKRGGWGGCSVVLPKWGRGAPKGGGWLPRGWGRRGQGPGSRQRRARRTEPPVAVASPGREKGRWEGRFWGRGQLFWSRVNGRSPGLWRGCGREAGGISAPLRQKGVQGVLLQGPQVRPLGAVQQGPKLLSCWFLALGLRSLRACSSLQSPPDLLAPKSRALGVGGCGGRTLRAAGGQR